VYYCAGYGGLVIFKVFDGLEVACPCACGVREGSLLSSEIFRTALQISDTLTYRC